MNLLLAMVITALAPWCLMRLHHFWLGLQHKAELFKMGCHPRQSQLERKWRLS